MLWTGVGQVATMAQLARVDAYGLINMIVEAVKTVGIWLQTLLFFDLSVT
jgi:hypothetical protein